MGLVRRRQYVLPCRDRLHRLEAVLALRDDFDVLVLTKLLANPVSRQRLVVNDDGSNRTRQLLRGRHAHDAARALLLLLRVGGLQCF